MRIAKANSALTRRFEIWKRWKRGSVRFAELRRAGGLVTGCLLMLLVPFAALRLSAQDLAKEYVYLGNRLVAVVKHGNPPPEPVSVTPSSGSGSSQTFSYVGSDASGYADIVWTSIVISNVLTAVNSCYVHYNQPQNQVYLRNDDSTAWHGPATLGVSGTLENSQCIVNVGNSSSSGNGNGFTLNVALTFKAAYSGSKTQYLRVQDTENEASAWEAVGSWTVP